MASCDANICQFDCVTFCHVLGTPLRANPHEIRAKSTLDGVIRDTNSDLTIALAFVARFGTVFYTSRQFDPCWTVPHGTASRIDYCDDQNSDHNYTTRLVDYTVSGMSEFRGNGCFV